MIKKPHLLKNGRKYNATRKTMYRSLSQDYQPPLPVRLEIHLQHRYRRTQQKTPRQVQRPCDVEVHAVEYWETSCAGFEQSKDENKDIDQVQGNLLRDLPEWLEDFTENLVDEGVSASRDTSASTSHESDPEPPLKGASRKHSIFTHFPKDRNFEVCKMTKIYKGSLQEANW